MLPVSEIEVPLSSSYVEPSIAHRRELIDARSWVTSQLPKPRVSPPFHSTCPPSRPREGSSALRRGILKSSILILPPNIDHTRRQLVQESTVAVRFANAAVHGARLRMRRNCRQSFEHLEAIWTAICLVPMSWRAKVADQATASLEHFSVRVSID